MSEYKRFTKKDKYGHWYTDTKINDRFMWSINGKIWERDLTNCAFDGEAIDRLAELEDKIENGTLIELHIPYGTELHFLYSREHYDKPQPPCVYSTKEWIFNVRNDGKMWFSVVGRGIGYFGEYLHEIGKTVFLTKAEAETRLKELQEKQL